MRREWFDENRHQLDARRTYANETAGGSHVVVMEERLTLSVALDVEYRTSWRESGD